MIIIDYLGNNYKGDGLEADLRSKTVTNLNDLRYWSTYISPQDHPS